MTALDPGVAAWAADLGLDPNTPEQTVLRAIAEHYRQSGAVKRWRREWARRHTPRSDGARTPVNTLPKVSFPGRSRNRRPSE